MSKAELQAGRIVASYGRRGVLETTDGSKHRYVLKGRKLKAVCGDLADWREQQDSQEALVTDIRPRNNILERPDSTGKAEPIAANLDRLLVVLAPAPEPDFFIADRYLCAAELMNATGVLIWNKADLEASLPAPMFTYRDLGYETLAVSAVTGEGIERLEQLLSQGISMLVGQSGVGKSSIINRLVPDADVAVGELSEASQEGRHTTTASFMHELQSGGQLIDSPGVRDFAPVIRDVRTVQSGFQEISALSSQCKFNDCQHLREPDCAVKAAVAEQSVSERRYESYKRLCNTVSAMLEQLH